ncbi:unnamed protein product [Calicophoron daubneyi]|uniref:C2H2-type domain-containing protein n=1 Tax=Calicophoron daubneyi TaxID=300641 RepID=A0AAV2TEB7_CALDB
MTMHGADTSANRSDKFQPKIRSIQRFKQLIRLASVTAESLPMKELPSAFQLSFALIEGISGLMLKACSVIKQDINPLNIDEEDGEIHYESCDLSCNIEQTRTSFSEEEGFDDLQNHCVKNSDSFQLSQTGPSNITDESRLCIAEIGEEPDAVDGSRPKCATTVSPERVSERSHLPPTPPSALNIAEKERSEKKIDLKSDFEDEIRSSVSPHGEHSGKSASQCSMHDARCDNDSNTYPSHMSELCGPRLREYPCVRMHTDLRRWRLTSTDRLNSLIDECERQVNGRKLYVCKFCGKVYEIKSSMRYHMKIIHLQMHLRTTEMQCRICGKQFTCVSAVNRHQSKCMMSTLSENGLHRNKGYPTPGSRPIGCGSGLPQGMKTMSDDQFRNISGNILGQTIPTYSGSSCVMSDNPILGTGVTKVTSQSAFYNPLSSASLLPEPDSHTVYHNALSSVNSEMSIGQKFSADFCVKSNDSSVTDGSLSPASRAPTGTDTAVPNSDYISPPAWNPAGTGWPNFANLGHNISELTPIQLEMCMKAVVRGFNSNMSELNSNFGFPSLPNQSNLEFHEASPANSLASVPFPLVLTPSEPQESKQSKLSNASEVAMDLSAHPTAETVMIESC